MSGPARDLWIEIGDWSNVVVRPTSGPARDLWIEIENICRAYANNKSGPARDLWIEIARKTLISSAASRRVPQGTCGLKLKAANDYKIGHSRVPQGTCGLKF